MTAVKHLDHAKDKGDAVVTTTQPLSHDFDKDNDPEPKTFRVLITHYPLYLTEGMLTCALRDRASV